MMLEKYLEYCPKCKEPTKRRIFFGGAEHIVMCACACKRNEFEKKEAEDRRREKRLALDEMRRIGFPDAEMRKRCFSADDNSNPSVSVIVRNYVKGFDGMKSIGKGLMFYGPVGTGKTFYAACAANELIDNGYSVIMTNFSRVTNILAESFENRQRYLDSLNRFDLVVLDDLAAERRTEYMRELVFTIIDARYRSGLPMIVTTNLTMDEIKNPKDEASARTMDRILERCFPVAVNGSSHRRKNIIAEYPHIKELLQG